MKRLFLASRASPPCHFLSRASLHYLPTPKPNFLNDTLSHYHCPKPEYYHYISRILARDDWFLLLKHELKAKRIPLHAQFIISILQTLDSSLLSLRFYLWATNIDSCLLKDRSVNRALGSILHRMGPVVLSPDLLSDLKNAGYAINTDLLCILITSWGKLGLIKYCDEVFGQISFLSIAPSTRLYNAVIDALVKANSVDMAYLKFHQMASDNCKPDRFTYNVLIHGVCKAGITDEAVRLVKAMEGAGCIPNVFTYTILIDGFCKARKLKEACGVIETMRARKVNPNEATVRSLISGAFQSASPKEAREVLLSHIGKEEGFYDVACGTALTCLAGKGMAREACDLIRELMESGYVPETSIADVVVACLLKDADLRETCEVVDMCIERCVGIGMGTLVRLAGALYGTKRVPEGDRYIVYMEEQGHMRNVYNYNMLIDCFCKGGLMNRATASFHEMSEKGISSNIVTLNTLISGHCRAGNLEEGKKLLISLLEKGFKPDVYTFNSMIYGLCRGNKVEDALGCFKEMKEWGIPRNAVTYNTVVRGLCLVGDVEKAVKLMRRMKKEGVKQDVQGYNALIECYCRMGKIEKAKKAFDSMVKLGLAPDSFSYGSFIKELFNEGRIDEATYLFWTMERRGCRPDSFLCSFLYGVLVKGKHFDDARGVLELCEKRGIYFNKSIT